MNNSISADDIGVAASQQQLFAPGIMTETRSLDSPKMAERGSGRPADVSSTRRDRRKAAISWYGKQTPDCEHAVGGRRSLGSLQMDHHSHHA